MDSVAPGTIIRRYMKAKHLMDFLKDGEFYIKRKRCFEDVHEKGLPVWRQIDMQIVEGSNPISISPKCVLLKKEEAQESRINANMPTSCWTDYIGENILMWQARQKEKGEDYVCIQSTVHKVATALVGDHHDVYCLRMQYVISGCLNCTRGNLYTKELAYAGEKEIRFYLDNYGCIKDCSDNHVYIKVNPPEMIDEIILSPYFDSQKAVSFAKEIKPTGIIVSQSKIKIKDAEL